MSTTTQKIQQIQKEAEKREIQRLNQIAKALWWFLLQTSTLTDFPWEWYSRLPFHLLVEKIDNFARAITMVLSETKKEEILNRIPKDFRLSLKECGFLNLLLQKDTDTYMDEDEWWGSHNF